VITSVANAIAGAAPNSPAKLFGRNASPNAANAETAIPPAMKRKKYSSIAFGRAWKYLQDRTFMEKGRFSAAHLAPQQIAGLRIIFEDG